MSVINFPQRKLCPANHKTVFVLDHTPYFGISCESHLEFDFIKSRATGYIPINPISKSLWTSSVESAIEYCRIVWDLFPQGKLIKFIASDCVAHILNGWTSSQQNISHILNGMPLIGTPPPPPPLRAINTPEHTVIHGLRAAIDSLSEATELQTEKRESRVDGFKFLNRCRVICITSARDNDSMKRLQEIFHNVLQSQNKQVQASPGRGLIIDHCHLVIINTFPVNIESQVTNHPPKTLSSLLTTEVHSISAPSIPNKLSTLILDHYDLASTTVTGIPMKEEQNASSSANYDVEIYHASSAHNAILKGNPVDAAAIRTIKEGQEYETVTLKWCTPRSCSSSEMQNCVIMHRITPVDVNSRPSLCLINFLLNGRSVMLEMPRKSGGKITSHLLASHGGEIFIHTLCTSRSVLEDPPSISEGCGGRVTDYRIPDFGIFIQQNRLLPIKHVNVNLSDQLPITKMKQKISRYTKYWPLTINSTYIFNLKTYIDPLPSIITREKLTDEEVGQCKQVIYNLISLESKHEPLHLTNVGQRVKGQKREDQYKATWNELEALIKQHLYTEQHRAIYSCLLECHKFNFDDGEVTKSGGEEKIEQNSKQMIDQAIQHLDQMCDSDTQRATVIRATTDSPMSPPPLANIGVPLSRGSRSSSNEATVGNTGGNSTTVSSPVNGASSNLRTLLDLFLARDKTKARPDFCGRLGDSPIAKLYPNLKIENERAIKGEAMVVD